MGLSGGHRFREAFRGVMVADGNNLQAFGSAQIHKLSGRERAIGECRVQVKIDFNHILGQSILALVERAESVFVNNRSLSS
jgi:hypothetical protein